MFTFCGGLKQNKKRTQTLESAQYAYGLVRYEVKKVNETFSAAK